MLTLNRRREADRVEAFVAAIRRTAHCTTACDHPAPPVDDAVRLPAFVAYAAADAPAVLESGDRRTVAVLVAMLVGLAACLAVGLATVAGPRPAPVVVEHPVVDLTSDTTAELTATRAVAR